MIRQSLVLCLLSFWATSLALGEEPTIDLEKYRAASEEKWQNAIKEFEARDQKETHPDDSILLIGSSSIRLWDQIETDLSPYHPIQRGFGGSKFSDLAIFADRIITPHQFRAVAIFVANDIKEKDTEQNKTPAEIANLFHYVHQKIRTHNPEAAVFYIPITPTEKRLSVWPQQKAANSAIREVCREEPNTFFIGTESIFLDKDGKPRNEYFREDLLHLNKQGYQLWAAAIKSHLDSVFDPISSKK